MKKGIYFLIITAFTFALAGCLPKVNSYLDDKTVFANKTIAFVSATPGKFTSIQTSTYSDFFAKKSSMTVVQKNIVKKIDGPYSAGETEYKYDISKADKEAIMEVVNSTGADFTMILWNPVNYVSKTEGVINGVPYVTYIHELPTILHIYERKTGKIVMSLDAETKYHMKGKWKYYLRSTLNYMSFDEMMHKMVFEMGYDKTFLKKMGIDKK